MITKKIIKISEQEITYIDEGSASNQPVLLLHGVPESSLLWSHIVPVIVSSGFRAIAPDLPGFGQSERFTTESTWGNYLRFIDDFLDALQLDELHLIVHDWGGLIGLRWACDHPDKISSLVISDTFFAPGYKWHPLARKWQTPGKGEKVMESMAKRELWMENMKKEIPGVDDRILDDFYHVFLTEQSRKVVLDLYRSANQQLLEPYQKLSMIQTPVTILWGEEDPYIHYEYAYKTREQQLPQADVQVIPNAGHFIHVEIPDQVKPLIENHFRLVRAGQSTI